MPLTGGRPVELGIAKDHPTKQEGEVVLRHIDWTGSYSSKDRRIYSKHVPIQPATLNHLLTNYFGSCLRMKNLNQWSFRLRKKEKKKLLAAIFSI